MEVRDGWNTELGRKKFDVTVDETDYHHWLGESGVNLANASQVPIKVKFRVFQLLAAGFSLAAQLEHHKDQGEGEAATAVQAVLDGHGQELSSWASALKEQFG